MQLVASLSFFRHFISRALRLGVVVLALFTILLSSLAPSGVAYAVCPDDPADCESEVDSSGNPTSGSGKSPADSSTSSTTPKTSGSGYTASGVASTVAGVLGFSGDKTISLLITALAAIYSAIGRAIGYLIPITIDIIINVLNYNSFGDSFVVTIGWPIMRDLVNMSVIIILLMIAIRTMVGWGGGAQGAQQAIGRVFFAVVLLNFSKTITLLLIDASQVVMLTFVNALDVATGNFVELFQINAFLSTSWDVVGNIDLQADTPNAVGFLVNSFLSTFLLAIVLMTLVILGIVFLYRIVVLWMLVVLSPVAMFFYGLGDTLPGASGAVEEWRKRFVGALTIGPILSFFLWLSLAAASQGAAIAETEGFTFFENETANAFLEIFQPGKLLSLGLGIMLLIIGMQLAASSAASLGEFSGNLVAKLPGWSAKLAKMSSLGAAKVGARAFERKTGVGQMVTNSFTAGAAKVQSGRSFLGNNRFAMGLGAAGAYVGGVAQDFTAEPNKTAREAARKRMAAMSDEQKHAYGMMLRDMSPEQLATLTETERDNARAFAFDYVTNNDVRKTEHAATVAEVKAANRKVDTESDDEYDERIAGIAAQEEEKKLKNAFKSIEENKGVYIEGDKERKKAFERAQIQHAHAAESPAKVGSAKRRAAMEALVNSENWSVSLNNENNLSDPDYLLALSKRIMRTTNDGTKVNALDDIVDSKGGVNPKARDMAKMIKAAAGGTSEGRIRDYVERMKAGGQARFSKSATVKPAEPVAAFASEKLDPSDLARAVQDGVEAANIEVDHLREGGDTTKPIDPNRINVVVNAFVKNNADMAGMQPGVEGPIVAAIEQLRDDAKASGKLTQEALARVALASAEKNDATRLQQIHLGTDGNFETATKADSQKVQVAGASVNIVVNNRATEVYKFRSAVPKPASRGAVPTATDMTEMIRETLTDRGISELKSEKQRADTLTKPGESKKLHDKVRGSVDVLVDALTAEVPKMIRARMDPDEIKAVRKQIADLKKINRY